MTDASTRAEPETDDPKREDPKADRLDTDDLNGEDLNGEAPQDRDPVVTQPAVPLDRPLLLPQQRFWTVGRAGGLLVALGSLLWMSWPSFSAKLGIIDDHEIVDMIGHHSHLPLTRIPIVVAHRTAEGNGRFRPVYWLFRAIESSIAGHNGTLWYVDRFLLAAVAVTAIYVTAVRFMWPVAAVVVSLVSFGGPQWEAYIRLGPNEAYAYPLLVAGIAVLVAQMLKGKSPVALWPGYLLLAASAYAKENFFLFLAIAVPVTALAYGIRRLRLRDYLVMAGALVLAAVDAIAILVVIHRYGVVYNPPPRTWQTFREWTTFAMTAANSFEYATVGAVAALVLLAVWSTTRRRLAISALLVLAILTIAVPQLVFYAGNPQVGRYLYPFVLAPTLAWGISLWQARILPAAGPRLLTTLVLLLTLAWPLHHALYLSHVGAQQNATNTQTFQQNLHNIEFTAETQHFPVVVVQMADSLVDGERTLSVAEYLANTTGLKVMMTPPATTGPGLDGQVARMFDALSRTGQPGILPYHKQAHCLAVLFGSVASVCPTAVGAPG